MAASLKLSSTGFRIEPSEAELLSEIAKKQIELGVPLKRVLISLMEDDAGPAFSALFSFAFKSAAATRAYPYRWFVQIARPGYVDPDGEYFQKLVALAEQNCLADILTSDLASRARAGRTNHALPSPTQARRLRIVTAAMPSFFSDDPMDYRGTGSRFKDWRLAWMKACDVKVASKNSDVRRTSKDGRARRPTITDTMQPKFDPVRAQRDADFMSIGGRHERPLSAAEMKQLKKEHYEIHKVHKRDWVYKNRNRIYDALVKRIEPLLK